MKVMKMVVMADNFFFIFMMKMTDEYLLVDDSADMYNLLH